MKSGPKTNQKIKSKIKMEENGKKTRRAGAHRDSTQKSTAKKRMGQCREAFSRKEFQLRAEKKAPHGGPCGAEYFSYVTFHFKPLTTEKGDDIVCTKARGVVLS